MADDLAVEETVDCMEKATTRAAINGDRVRGQEIFAGSAVDQNSCACNTCIANNVLSRRAWKALLPRFVKRSSPKSNFISL